MGGLAIEFQFWAWMIVTTTGGNNKASKDNKNIISVTLGIRKTFSENESIYSNQP